MPSHTARPAYLRSQPPIPTPRWKLRISKEKKLLELHLETKTEKEWDFADFVCTILRELAFVLPFVSGLSIVWMGKRKQNRLRERIPVLVPEICARNMDIQFCAIKVTKPPQQYMLSIEHKSKIYLTPFNLHIKYVY